MSEVLKKIDEFGGAVLAMRKSADKQFAEIVERIEILETAREKPKGKAGARGVEFSEFETPAGKMYALPGSTKMQDVPALMPEQPPEVSLYRWLAAAVAGEKCGDRIAVQYAKEIKQMTTAKTPLARPRAIENMEFLVTSNVAGDNTSSPLVPTTIYLGDFRDLTVGIRREASIDQLRVTTYASNLLIEFVGYLRADYVARRPASFHTIEGIAA
jgi:hypothetical protein